MQLIIAAIVLAVLIAIAEVQWGIKEPWRTIAIIGLAALLISGILILLGVWPFR